MEPKKFMAIWFSTIIIGGILAGATLRVLSTRSEHEEQNSALIDGRQHFSVKWLGFLPSYNNQTPDYYIAINNLKNTQLQMSVAVQIQNFENSSYWFLIGPYGTPPSGWAITNYQIGLIGIDQTTSFVYSNIIKEKPASIPEGRTTESVNLVVGAYRDSSYTNLYSQDNFTVRFHLIDLTSSSWTTRYNNNFDDGTTQGWSYTTGGNAQFDVVYYSEYRSWPCTLRLGTYGSDRAYLKTFDTSGPFTEAYLVYAVKSQNWATAKIFINDVQYFQADVQPSNNVWYQFAIPLPLNPTVKVTMYAVTSGSGWIYAYLDDVYVIEK